MCSISWGETYFAKVDDTAEGFDVAEKRSVVKDLKRDRRSDVDMSLLGQ